MNILSVNFGIFYPKCLAYDWIDTISFRKYTFGGGHLPMNYKFHEWVFIVFSGGWVHVVLSEVISSHWLFFVHWLLKHLEDISKKALDSWWELMKIYVNMPNNKALLKVKRTTFCQKFLVTGEKTCRWAHRLIVGISGLSCTVSLSRWEYCDTRI